MDQRLNAFLNHLGISHRNFADSIGVTRQQLEGWLNQKVKIPISSLQKIAIEYKQLNVRWLLIGEGNMLLTDVALLAKESLEEHNKERIKILGNHFPVINEIDFDSLKLAIEFTELQKKHIKLLEELIMSRGNANGN